MSKNNFAFFGTSSFAVTVLEELMKAGFIPSLIVTTPDTRRGRGLELSPSPVKVWAEKNKTKVLAPETLSAATENFSKQLDGLDFFVVASYGKIIPKSILDIPKHGTVNVHPSLLPKLRGASPIETAILTENGTGVTIMLVDEEIDHGPIIAQKEIGFASKKGSSKHELEWPPYADDLENLLAHDGGKLLAEILPDWLAGKIEPLEQSHDSATYTKKIAKEDGLINLSDNSEKNLRKIRAFHVSPGAYFFTGNIRVKIKRAEIKDGQLVIMRVVPEGKKEMDYEDFLRGLKK